MLNYFLADMIRYFVSRGKGGVSEEKLYIGPWSPMVEKNIRTEVINFGTNKIRGDIRRAQVAHSSKDNLWW